MKLARLAIAALAGAALLASAAGARDTRSAYSFREVVSGLSNPLYLAAPAGERGRLYVVEQAGRIVLVENGRVRPEPLLDIRDRVTSGGEQGLLSVAFHPRYASNRRFYVDYTDRNGDTRVVEYRSDGTRARPGTARQLLFVDQPYSNHNGGQLQFGPDGKLYVGMGDGGSGGDPEDRAQNATALLGKLLAIDVDRPRARPRITALGLRNPWRFSFDRRTKDLWIGDVGQNAWEEVDYTPRAQLGTLRNYGWDVWEGRARYDRKSPSRGRLVWPVVTFPTGGGNCAVTGGYVYRGTAVPAASGRYFYGDYCGGWVSTLRIAGGRARDVRREPFRIPQLASFGEDAAGELYAVSLDGSVFRLAA